MNNKKRVRSWLREILDSLANVRPIKRAKKGKSQQGVDVAKSRDKTSNCAHCDKRHLE